LNLPTRISFGLGALLALLSALLSGCGAVRQPAGRGEAAIRPFAVTGRQGRVFIRGDIHSEEEEVGEEGRETEEEGQFFEEGVEYSLDGYIYHPRLLDWDAQLRMSLTQDDFEINDRDFDSDGTLLAYSLAAALLKEKPVSMRAFASETDDVLAREFAG
jgi:hypothetical protein